jgi:beta-phosphoglucomutase-like phosphatase (HAD superfamily)
MTVSGVILDVDGTLVLSNDAHAQAWVEAFAAYGYFDYCQFCHRTRNGYFAQGCPDYKQDKQRAYHFL